MLLIADETIRPGTGHEAGRALLAALYRAHTGKPLPPIAVTERGKPYFPGGELHFSISHTKNHVFCALSDEAVGIDAEELDRDISLRLAEKVLSPTELTQYRAAPDPRRTLLTFWVLKEAAAKCTGEGLRGYPNHTAFSLDDPRVTVRGGCLLAVIRKSDLEQEEPYVI